MAEKDRAYWLTRPLRERIGNVLSAYGEFLTHGEALDAIMAEIADGEPASSDGSNAND